MVDIVNAVIDEKLDQVDIKWSKDNAACIVMASGGYPEAYKKGIEMDGFDENGQVDGAVVFHAGTKFENGKFYTNGGRVIGVTAKGETLEKALDNLRTIWCEHKSKVKTTLERSALFVHSLNSWHKDCLHTNFCHIICIIRVRADCSHTACVKSLVTV